MSEDEEDFGIVYGLWISRDNEKITLILLNS